MFWSGNYILVRELNILLKEENVTLAQVLEADDILQECKADNKALIQFLTKPEILEELITLITQEPSTAREMMTQYRHATIACEVLTSQLSMLSDRLSLDTAQMNRLCDFVNKEPPLNSLLASFFSKTIEMFLERSPKQDWYLYHIVCLRVLDFFRARRDFLPNLLRHIATSAIADIFKYFIRLDDLFSKVVLDWFEEHNVLESLIEIICGTYVPEPIQAAAAHRTDAPEKGQHEASEKEDALNYKRERDGDSKTENEKDTKSSIDGQNAESPPCTDSGDTEESRISSTADNASVTTSSTDAIATVTDQRTSAESMASVINGISATNDASALATSTTNDGAITSTTNEASSASKTREDSVEAPRPRGEAWIPSVHPRVKEALAARTNAVASTIAAELLCDLVLTGCSVEGATNRSRISWTLASRAASEAGVRALLQGMFTCAGAARRHALVNGCRLLLAMLHRDRAAGACGGEAEAERSAVELAAAPHLPLLHNALLHAEPALSEESAEPRERGEATARRAVGATRVHIASLLAMLAASDVDEVATTMLTLGTPGLLVDMFFEFPNNNFLHGQVYALLKAALANRAYRTQYARHLIVESNLLTRLMDVFEENENEKGASGARSGYMGYVILMLKRLDRALDPCEGELPHQLSLDDELMARWNIFVEDRLKLVLQLHDTPLGGYYPSENIYEVEDMTDTMAIMKFNDISMRDDDYRPQTLTTSLDNDEVEIDEGVSGGHFMTDEDDDKMSQAKNDFLELNSQRFSDDMWEDAPSAEGEDEPADGAPLDQLHSVLAAPSPWETASESMSSAAGEGWAQFEAEAFTAPPDPFSADGFSPFAAANAAVAPDYAYWGFDDNTHADSKSQAGLEQSMQNLHLEVDPTNKPLDDASTVELTNNLLTAMSSMSPEAIANIVNANLTPPPLPLAAQDKDGETSSAASDRDDTSER